jgi:uncharacterized membrane protein
MQKLIMNSVFVGIFWGIWPLLMNKSGLSGNISSLAFVVIMFVCIVPFNISSFVKIPTGINWTFVITAGICGAIGTLLFNKMLHEASVKNVGLLIVIEILVCLVISAVYQVCNNGITLKQGIGFVFASLAAILLTV